MVVVFSFLMVPKIIAYLIVNSKDSVKWAVDRSIDSSRNTHTHADTSKCYHSS